MVTKIVYRVIFIEKMRRNKNKNSSNRFFAKRINMKIHKCIKE